MKSTLTQKVLWILGVGCSWLLAWTLLGIRAALIIKDQPHPFLQGVKLTGPMLEAVAYWALAALLVNLMVGLIASLLVMVGVGHQDPGNFTFRKGLLVGAATLLWIHGVLYGQVPTALATLPGFKQMPMALALLLLLGGGAALMVWVVGRSAKNLRTWRVLGILATLTAMLWIPHDLFRKLMPGPSELPSSRPRLLMVSFDALRKDTFQQVMPEWKPTVDATTICALPATRLTWNILLGASPDKMRYSKVMPSRTEFRNPDELTLLRLAELNGLRSAFVIDDSLTPSFGLQPNLFTTVLEPDGGWKYWFTLGFGTCWPVYSWGQNYLSPVETTNAWCDTKAYYRDLDRQLQNHDWVSSHNCELHAPITLRFEELRAFTGWRWLAHSARAYKAYSGVDELLRDKGARIGSRADASKHFQIRSRFLLQRLKPFLARWEQRYPNLSGVVTSDHGEDFLSISDEKGRVLSHFSGIHGFNLSPDTIRIPMLPFGQTTSALHAGEVFSWLDLREAIRTWLAGGHALRFIGTQEGRSIQMPTIRAVHLEKKKREEEARARLASTHASDAIPGSGNTTASASAPDTAGIHPSEILQGTTFLPNGIWFCDDPSPESMARTPMSGAIIQGQRIITYNPEEGGVYSRKDFVGYQQVGHWPSTRKQMDLDIATFEKTHLLPPAPDGKE